MSATSISVSDVIAAIETAGEPAIVAVLDGLCGPCGALAAAPLAALVRLADAVGRQIAAKNELAAMQAAVKAADAGVDAAEAASVEAATKVPS